MEIYALCDPDSSEARYVGAARDARARLKGHVRVAFKSEAPLYVEWLRGLLLRGKMPKVEIVGATDDWCRLERNSMLYLRAAGHRLLNVSKGGERPSPSKETQAANGRKNAKAIHSDPRRKKIWSIKQRLGILLRDGCVNDATRQKMRKLAVDHPETFGEWVTV